MPGDPMTTPPHAPAGLKYARGYSSRFWVRTDSVRFQNLFAVHFAVALDALHVNVLEVRGYLGQFEFEWSKPDHAAKILLAAKTSDRSLALFGDLLAGGLGEWLLTNAGDAGEAKSCDDAKYVGFRCLSESATHGRAGVYFISNGRGAVKIGKSHGCMNGRYIALQTANPDPLRVVAVVCDPDPAALEKAVHASLEHLRIRGEWFAVSDSEAVQVAIKYGGIPVDFC